MTTATIEHQPTQALERANYVRFNRAKLKRSLHAGDTRAVAVLLDPPDYAQSMTVRELLRAQRQWGKTKTDRCLRDHDLSHAKTVEGLTERQRVLLVRALLDGGS